MGDVEEKLSLPFPRLVFKNPWVRSPNANKKARADIYTIRYFLELLENLRAFPSHPEVSSQHTASHTQRARERETRGNFISHHHNHQQQQHRFEPDVRVVKEGGKRADREPGGANGAVDSAKEEAFY